MGALDDELARRRIARDAERRGAAKSEYGQIRLTVTFERSGRASYRALAKTPDDQWRELNVFAAGYDDFGVYPPTFEDALAYFASVAEGLRWAPSIDRD